MAYKFYALKLSVIIIIVFILQNLITGFTNLFVLNQSSYIEIWRLLSAIFLHGSVIHIAYNLLALILFGSILEGLIGGKKFLIIFFVSGIVANLIAVNFYDTSLGASGAIFGVIGALIVVRPTLTVFAFGLPMPLFIAGILWVTGDIIGIYVPSGVGNIAHLSGIAIGIMFGLFYRDWKKEVRKKDKIVIDEQLMRGWEEYYLK